MQTNTVSWYLHLEMYFSADKALLTIPHQILLADMKALFLWGPEKPVREKRDHVAPKNLFLTT